jgi:hypothetical protein
MEHGVHKLDVEESKEGGLWAYADIGRCEFACPHCGALKWKAENQPNWCCGKGFLFFKFFLFVFLKKEIIFSPEKARSKCPTNVLLLYFCTNC